MPGAPPLRPYSEYTFDPLDEADDVTPVGEAGLGGATDENRVTRPPPPPIPAEHEAVDLPPFGGRSAGPLPAPGRVPEAPMRRSVARLVTRAGRESIPRILTSAERISQLLPGQRLAFVFGLIDGIASVESIIDMSGMAEEEVVAALAEVLELGLMELLVAPPPPRSSLPPRIAAPPSPPPPRSTSMRPSTAPAFDGAFREQVDAMLARVESAPLSLLGARSDEVLLRKKRLHRLIAQFHPDRFPAEELGPYRAKLERICALLLAAHEGQL